MKKELNGQVFLNGKIFTNGDSRKVGFYDYIEVLFKNEKGIYEVKKGYLKQRLYSLEFLEDCIPDEDVCSEEDKYIFRWNVKTFPNNENEKDFDLIESCCVQPDSMQIKTYESYAKTVAAYLNGERNIVVVGIAYQRKTEKSNHGCLKIMKVESMNEKGFYSEGTFWTVNKKVHINY